MKTLQSSRYVLFLFLLLGLCSAGPALAAPSASTLSDSDLEKIGRRIWDNESDLKIEGLTSWNSGEDFASLGIGHFIWYPEGKTGPFEESFPPLVQHLVASGVQVPEWLRNARGCPWPDRKSFRDDSKSQRQVELRTLLVGTVKEQTRFIIARLQATVPKLQAAAGANGQIVAQNIAFLRATPAGNFAMIDYVNFKGDGLSSTERYNGQGWGLLQVLETMRARDAAGAPAEFARASAEVLTKRVQNSPLERGEKRWLVGWVNRCNTYAQRF